MPARLNEEIHEEAELIERFVHTYRRRFATAIDLLNRRPALQVLDSEIQCLRLCVETMDMVLVNQDRLARALRKVCSTRPAAFRAA